MDSSRLHQWPTIKLDMASRPPKYSVVGRTAPVAWRRCRFKSSALSIMTCLTKNHLACWLNRMRLVDLASQQVVSQTMPMSQSTSMDRSVALSKLDEVHQNTLHHRMLSPEMLNLLASARASSRLRRSRILISSRVV